MKILLIRLRLIGDVVFTTPIPRAIKREWPDASVSYLVEEAAAPILATNRFIDELIVVQRARGVRRVLEDIRLSARLRSARYDVVLDLHGGPRSSLLTFASGAAQRIGYAVKGRSWLYTTVVARPRELRARHSVINQWDLVEAIASGTGHGKWPGGPADPARDAVEMPLDRSADDRVERRRLEVSFFRQLLETFRVAPGVGEEPVDRLARGAQVLQQHPLLGDVQSLEIARKRYREKQRHDGEHDQQLDEREARSRAVESAGRSCVLQ